MDLTAFVVFRRTTKQLIVSISGSANLKHAIQNLRAVRMAWRPGSTVESVDGNVDPSVGGEFDVRSSKSCSRLRQYFLATSQSIIL